MLYGCASSLSVDRVSDTPIDTTTHEIVLLDSTKFDYDLKKSLIKYGFKVKNTPSIVSKEKKVDESTSLSYNISEARYGINQYPGAVIDWCLYNKQVKFDEYTLELVDLETNDTILFIKKGGWTGNCFPSTGKLFEELALELKKNWE